LERLTSSLQDAGFDRIIIKLPHNLVGMENQEVSLNEFLERERNYPSVILIAMNTERRETIKILFVNISRKAFFADDTFPSGHSEPSEVFVQSPDPARVYALSGFFGEYFRNSGRKMNTPRKFLLHLFALVLLYAEFLSFIGGKEGFISSVYPSLDLGVGIDLILSAVALYITFTSYRTPTGLYVNIPPKQSIWTLANRALKGQVMDNPVVSFVVTIIAGIVTAIILRLLGLP
jgi:hypothetical protein